MVGSHGTGSHGRLKFVVVVAAVTALCSVAVASEEQAELRIVAVMHENLAAINEIEESLVRDDYVRIESKAALLKTNAQFLKEVDLALLGLDPKKDATFDKHLAAGEC